MPLTADCPNCGKAIRGLPDAAAGTRVPCPECNWEVSVPAPLKRIRTGEAPPAAKPAVSAATRETAHSMVVTSTPNIEGCRIEAYLGLESVEMVMGTGALAELTSGIQDLIGSRSTAFEKKMKSAKEEAFHALRLRAAERGGNAIVGVNLAYAPFDGNRMALVISGTVVKIRRIKAAE